MNPAGGLSYHACLADTLNSSLELPSAGGFTISEIRQQPDTWPVTFERVRKAPLGRVSPPVITGAGTSAYAAIAIESAWPGSRAIASTELLFDFEEPLSSLGTVVSLARSGDSPESVAVVRKIQKRLPSIRHIALTCNPHGKLANWPGVEAVLLDPLSNDRSLVMTSSFSNLVLAGIALSRPAELEQALPVLCAGARTVLGKYEAAAKALAAKPPARVVALGSAPLFGAAREATLKVLEITSARIPAIPETYLGLRHGPMSFVNAETLVLCLISSDPKRRRYEMDLVNELRAKKIGRLVGLAPADADTSAFDEVVTTEASSLPDYLRTPVEIVFCQLLAYHLSLRFGLDPDNPSPGGVINRVVQGVRIYED